MKTTTITFSKTELVKHPNGKWYYKELSRIVVDEGNSSSKKPEWWSRFIELRKNGKTYGECADQLNDEGFTSKGGNKIRQNSLIVLYSYHTKKS